MQYIFLVHCRNVDKATTRIVGGTLAEVGEFTGQVNGNG